MSKKKKRTSEYQNENGRFKRGNPGRPKGAVDLHPRGMNLVPHLRKILNAPAEGFVDKTRGQVVMEVLVERAKRGNLKAVNMILDRVEGKPKETQEVNVNRDITDMSDRELKALIKKRGGEKE